MKRLLITLFTAAIFTATVNAQTTLLSTKGENKMNTIIIYSSTTGFTKQYAEWISEATGFEAVELKSVTAQQIQNAERVVFGSSLKAGVLLKLDKIKKMNPKNLVIFAVGLTEKSADYSKSIVDANKIGDTPFFYMRGGVKFSKLGFFERAILKKITGLSEDTDYSSKDNIAELVEFLNK